MLWLFKQPPTYPFICQCGFYTVPLGDMATPDIIDAWTEGYFFLADLLINIEKNIKKQHAEQKGKSCTESKI